MRKLFIAFCFAAACMAANAQEVQELKQPKLVVGIMVDQMRWDYLTRYADLYCDGGFKRMMREGYNCNRCMINYIPAITAVGHTSVYSGSIPAMTGIVGNSFEINGERVYCTEDTLVRGLGCKDSHGNPDPNSSYGKNSPRNMLVTTVTDQLRLATNFRSKVIGVALKDRASILPAGHSANAAYWMDGKSMNFISSTYYMDKLPQWVVDFNNRQLGEKYMENLAVRNKKIKDGPWELLLDESKYVQSAPKNQRWEANLDGSLKLSPWGATITFDMAKAAVEGENLGNNSAGVPDFLAVSISSTDMLGHKITPNSIFQEDAFLRLDRDVSEFLDFLDKRVGKGNYLVFLSADHGGSHNVDFRKQHKIPGDTWESARVKVELESALRSQFPQFDKIVNNLNNMQVHLTNNVRKSPQYDEVKSAAIKYLNALPEVAYAFEVPDIPQYVPEPIRTMAINGYCPGRSGDVQIIFHSRMTEDFASLDELKKPGHYHQGTTHSIWNPDDTHIPLIFMGWNVPHRWDNKTCHIVDIAATISAILNIQQPSACVGNPIF